MKKAREVRHPPSQTAPLARSHLDTHLCGLLAGCLRRRHDLAPGGTLLRLAILKVRLAAQLRLSAACGAPLDHRSSGSEGKGLHGCGCRWEKFGQVSAVMQGPTQSRSQIYGLMRRSIGNLAERLPQKKPSACCALVSRRSLDKWHACQLASTLLEPLLLAVIHLAGGVNCSLRGPFMSWDGGGSPNS